MPRSPGRIKLVRPSTILGIPASSGTPMLGAAWTLYSGEHRGNGNSLYRPKVGTRFGSEY